MKVEIVDIPTPKTRRNASTQEAVNVIANLPVGKAAKIAKEDASTARTAAKYYQEDAPGFVVKTQAQADGGILLWREEKPVEAPKAEGEATQG